MKERLEWRRGTEIRVMRMERRTCMLGEGQAGGPQRGQLMRRGPERGREVLKVILKL